MYIIANFEILPICEILIEIYFMKFWSKFTFKILIEIYLYEILILEPFNFEVSEPPKIGDWREATIS